MACQAATSNIKDILLAVLVFHRLLVMTAVTIDVCAATAMALAALPTSASMIHREGVV
jgi:hypothetical protein